MKLIYSHTEALDALLIAERVVDGIAPSEFTHFTPAEYLEHLAKQPFTTVTDTEIIIDIPEEKTLAVLAALREFSGTLVHVVKAAMALAELFKDAAKRFERRIDELMR